MLAHMLVLTTLLRPRSPLLQTARLAPHQHTCAMLEGSSAVADPRACMGTWYVQRQIPALAFLEAGARNGAEQYEWEEAICICIYIEREGGGREREGGRIN